MPRFSAAALRCAVLLAKVDPTITLAPAVQRALETPRGLRITDDVARRLDAHGTDDQTREQPRTEEMAR